MSVCFLFSECLHDTPLSVVVQDSIHRYREALNLDLETIQRIGPLSKMGIAEQFFQRKSQFLSVFIIKVPWTDPKHSRSYFKSRYYFIDMLQVRIMRCLYDLYT